MPRFGRADATGRSSGIVSGKERRVSQPPKGEPWVWLTRALMLSPAMRARSSYACKAMDFLLVEHMNHAGQCNSELIATFDQLVAFGIPRKFVSSTLFELESLGLVRREHGGGRDDPSRFSLTCFSTGLSKPTNDWEKISAEDAAAVSRQVSTLRQRARGVRKVQFAVPHGGTRQVPHGVTRTSTPRGNLRAV